MEFLAAHLYIFVGGLVLLVLQEGVLPAGHCGDGWEIGDDGQEAVSAGAEVRGAEGPGVDDRRAEGAAEAEQEDRRIA